MTEPITLDCVAGWIPLGDWSKWGALECCSGGAWYRKTVTPTPEQARCEISLLTLLIEPANKDGSKRVKNLVRQIHVGKSPTDQARVLPLSQASEGAYLPEGGALVFTRLPFQGGAAQLDAAINHLQELIAKDPRPSVPTPK